MENKTARFKRPWSISGKLWLAMTMLILVVLGGLGITITWLFSDFYLQQKLDSLRIEATDTAVQLASTQDWSERLATLQTLKLSTGTQLVLLDAHGQVQAVGGNYNLLNPQGGMGWGYPGMGLGLGGLLGRWANSLNPTDFFSEQNLSEVLAGNTLSIKALPSKGSDGQAMLIAAAPLGKNPVQGVVLLGSSPVPVQESINTFRRLIFYASLIAVLLATIVSLFFARQVTRPLALMQKAASRLANGDFQPIQGVNSKDELGELAEALNSMGESLRNHVAWLSQERNLLQGIVEGMSDAVIMISANGHLLYANDPARLLWLNDDHEQIELKSKILEFLQNLTKDINNSHDEAHILTLGMQVLEVGMAVMPETEGLQGYVAVLRDVTASLRAEKERRDFLANVTHELRTPLHLIQGYLEAIQDGVIPPAEQGEHIEMVLEEARRLAGLVKDLQEMNRLERGQPLQFKLLNIREFLSDLNQRFQHRAQELGIRLLVNAVSGEILADRDRLLQVFINLLDNAFRYTPPGRTVMVNAVLNEKTVLFSVKDQGEGIAPEALSHIFERFYRADKSRSRKEGGMGLGLAIVKQIIEGHGGNIRVESTIAQGTTFLLEFPLKSASGQIGQEE